MSLSHIWAATYADDHEFIFIFDHGVDPIVRAVATAFPATHKRMHYSPAHEFMSGNRSASCAWLLDYCHRCWALTVRRVGGSFNLLEGYRYAHVVARTLRSELVYLLEEDVWIARDYFSFHRAAHSRKHMAIGGMPPTVRSPPMTCGRAGQHTLSWYVCAACNLLPLSSASTGVCRMRRKFSKLWDGAFLSTRASLARIYLVPSMPAVMTHLKRSSYARWWCCDTTTLVWPHLSTRAH